MRFRKPSRVEITVQIILALVLAGLIYDYVEALGSNACGSPRGVSQGCYPWGMTEGPMEGGSWNYMTKEIYLKSSLVGNAILATAIIAPFLAPGRWSGLAAILTVLVLGFYNLRWLTSLT
ncbi:hypothetical protein [Methylobacterium oxalidis]|uniref:hypothetical protein n=1 Tax=Methylobacterium oxalidis TaxID=944322 RepID=UPI0033158AD6